MITIILGSALIGVALLALALQRFYSSVPARELRRLSKRGDHLAQSLYRPVAYGASMRTLLWLVAIAALAGGFVLLMATTPGTIGALTIAAVLAVAFVVVPSLRLNVHSAQLAAFMAPAVAFLLRYLHTPLDMVARLVNKGRDLYHHSRLYEKEDLTELLHHQKEQVGNRISLEELELAQRALQFTDRKAIDIVQSRTDTYLVSADEAIGPILLAELHKSGQNSFLVYKDKQENIMGSLLMRDAVNAKQGGRVLDLIRSDLCYVREDFSLRQVLLAFQKTGHHTAVVINIFEEFLGIITLDALLSELVGDAVDEVENYEDRTAVAEHRLGGTLPETGTVQVDDATGVPQLTSPQATEVVE